MESRRIEMASLRRILARTFFWSYERGSWQYDIAVVVILIFVLLTPRAWFHDEPQNEIGVSGKAGRVLLVSEQGDRQIYRVDARVIAPPETPALQNDLHTALQRSLSDLHNGRFSIAKIEAVRDESGTVIAYQVEIRH
jgi:hypothetical protein